MASHEFYFFYAPSWDYPLGGPIKIGNVITSVKKPHRPLACVPPLEESDIFITEKKSVQYTKEKLRSGKFSILTKFLSIFGFGVDVGAEIDNRCVILPVALDTKMTDKLSDEERFTFDTLETTQFTPTNSYLQTCIESANVRHFLEMARYRKPVYIITGIKVVTGAQANSQKSRTIGGSLGVEVDGTILSSGVVPIGGGPSVEGKLSQKTGTAWESNGEFVFAFRVSRVFVGKKDGHKINEDEYRKGAMLGDDTEDVKRPELFVLKSEEPSASAEGFDSEKLWDDEDVVCCAIPKQDDSDD